MADEVKLGGAGNCQSHQQMRFLTLPVHSPPFPRSGVRGSQDWLLLQAVRPVLHERGGRQSEPLSQYCPLQELTGNRSLSLLSTLCDFPASTRKPAPRSLRPHLPLPPPTVWRMADSTGCPTDRLHPKGTQSSNSAYLFPAP